MQRAFLTLAGFAFLSLLATPILIHAGNSDPPDLTQDSFNQGIYFFCKKQTKYLDDSGKRNEKTRICMEEQQAAYNGLVSFKQAVEVPDFILKQCIYSYVRVDVQWADFVRVNHCVKNSLATTGEVKASF